MGRPRGKLLDESLMLANPRQWIAYGPVTLVPVLRRFPEVLPDPAFWLAYDTEKIEDRVAPAETDEQSLLVARCRREAGMRLTAFPNGGWREEETAIKMKSEGMTTGMPDLIVWGGVAWDRGAEWAKLRAETLGKIKGRRWDQAFDKGLEAPIFLEMKKRNSYLTDIRETQLTTLEEISRQGWPTCVCFGAKAALVWLRHCGLYVPE